MARFDLLKTLGLKKPANDLFNVFKKQLEDLIDEGIAAINDGSLVHGVVPHIAGEISDAVASATFPGFGEFVYAIVARVDWLGLAMKPAQEAVKELQSIKAEIAGWKL